MQPTCTTFDKLCCLGNFFKKTCLSILVVGFDVHKVNLCIFLESGAGDMLLNHSTAYLCCLMLLRKHSREVSKLCKRKSGVQLDNAVYAHSYLSSDININSMNVWYLCETIWNLIIMLFRKLTISFPTQVRQNAYYSHYINISMCEWKCKQTMALGLHRVFLGWGNEFRANDGISLESQIFLTALQYNLKWLQRLFF